MIEAGAVLAQLLPGLEAQMRERRAIGVQEAVFAIADRDRVAERAHDRLEAPLASAQRLAQFLQQVLAFCSRDRLGGIGGHRPIIRDSRPLTTRIEARLHYRVLR